MNYLNKCECNKHHQKYLNAFTNQTYQLEYFTNITQFVLDSELSPDNSEDVDLFQALLFDGMHGRIHIIYYENLFYSPWLYKISPEKLTKVFARYLDYLDKMSTLFTLDALHFIFKQQNPYLIECLLNDLSVKNKLQMIRLSELYPEMIQTVPKLKLYNLFS